MRFVLFYHSLVSDWNHGNAHFLRGIASELLHRGHIVEIYEPHDGWSRSNLVAQHGDEPLHAFARAYPELRSSTYDRQATSYEALLERVLDGADVVLVHEWNDPELVAAIGAHRREQGRYALLFHDTHHRIVSAPHEMERCDLTHYDGVLAFGEVIRQGYLDRGWTHRAFTWHEAADVRVFHPRTAEPAEDTGDLVWIGNWGDDERSEELYTYLLDPATELGLRTRIYGVRWPDDALAALRRREIAFAGWLANYAVPEVFARHRATIHVPRRPYARALPGIPTIRVFEALASGIPLISAPWDDVEGLFHPGQDYLVARTGEQMKHQLRALLSDPAQAEGLRRNGLARIRARHTCHHRVEELLAIVTGLLGRTPRPQPQTELPSQTALGAS